MSSKQQQAKGPTTDKNVVETADPTVDDDNKSDSEYEYEYEEIEVEVDEDYEDEYIDETGSKVLISEVETIVPKEEKKAQETLVLKSDGTTQKLVQKSKATRTIVSQEKQQKQEKQEKMVKQTKIEKIEKVEKVEKVEKSKEIEKSNQVEKEDVGDKSRLGRPLTSQEESILLPLLQGLLAANGNDVLSISKQESTTSQEKEPPTSNKNSRSNSLAEKNETSDLAKGSNILDELSTALNRLQNTLLEEKETVTDTRKRNTILTLVAWLKRVLSTNNDNTEAQLFSLTELLPTELLLTKLMPQLMNGNDNENDEQTPDDRSPSSKRFSRQKNNRFNTVGVSKEELADARLYLQKKLLSENLATGATKVSHEVDQQTILDDSDDSRRKSLNLTFSNDLDKDIRSIFHDSKNSFSKSIDIVPSPDDVKLKNVFPLTGIEHKNVLPTSTRTEQSKTAFRRKSNPSLNQDVQTDSDDDDSANYQQKTSNGSAINSHKSMNKFAMRKLKMKRANTIDIPKEQLGQDFSNSNNINYNSSVNDIHQNINENCNSDVDKDHMPDFKVKSSSDKKFLAFLNKNTEENHSSWVNPHKTILPVQQMTRANNWSSKFGSIKNSFEHIDAPQLPVSPRLAKRNNFTHAPTSPFKPVQGNKPPQVPNGVHHYQYNNQNVQHKIAAIQSIDKQPSVNPNLKPQLRTHQSVPSYQTDEQKLYRDPNVHVKNNDWQQNKYASVDSYMNNSVSPKVSQGSYNPLYVPLNKNPSQSPSSSLYASPHSNQITPKSQVTASPNEFPTYTFTSTDYTQPSCVSTFGPDGTPVITPPVVKNTSPVIKNTILPDTSYLKSKSPSRAMPPLLGSSKLNKQMKTVDVYSSNEYLSEPNNYYRTPQPFSPTYDYNYPPKDDSYRSSGEFMATSQIMKYPQSQTATVVNKVSTRYDDEQQATNLRNFLTNNRNEKRQSEYSEKSMSPLSEPNFSHVNQTYVPPVEPPRTKPNSFVSMDNVSSTQFNNPEQGAPIRLRNNTAFYGSHHVLGNDYTPKNDFIPQQSYQHKFDSKLHEQSKMSAPVRLNSCGGQYIQPKVESDLDFSKPSYGRKPTHGNISQNNVIKNNVTNLNRSNTTSHQRVGNYEIKRKQSLPAQNADYFDSHFDNQNDDQTPNNNYLPFGALKKSKSTHTLALLQQFEGKGKTEEPPLPSYIRRPNFNQPTVEMKPKSIIKKTPKVEEMRPIQAAPRPVPPIQHKPQAPIQQEPKPFLREKEQFSPEPKPFLQDIKPFLQDTKPFLQEQNSFYQEQKQFSPEPKLISQDTKPFLQEQKPILQESKPILPKSQPISQPIAPIRPKSPPQMAPIRPKTPPKSVPIRPKTPPQARPKSPPQKNLQAPEINEIPSSPLVEDGHIIYPGQTADTKRRVQHYAQTLNKMLNRKSIVIDSDEDDISDKNDVVKPLQRSKSGTLLQVPKQYESAIKRSEVLKKEQTVAAYFSGNKSPQGLQRSSSQHSVQSSASTRTVEERKSNTISPLEGNASKSPEIRESSSRITTTSKSAHHLKILRKKQTSPNPLAKSQTLPSINLLDESNVDDAFDDLFASFGNLGK